MGKDHIMNDDEVRDALKPLVDTGFTIDSSEIYPQQFGNMIVTLGKGALRLKFTRERGEWYADIGLARADPEEFSSTHVLREVGVEPSEVSISLEPIAQQLAETSTLWQRLFQPSEYTSTKGKLEKRQRDYAREAFGYKPS
jgi:hypothetical protein